MQAIAAGLLAKGLAYEAGGNVFFDVRRFPEYGKLSGNLLAQMLAGVRDAADPYRRNPEDFPLWKLAEPGREMSWESPWGRGFPGWHIECSAMAIKHLGEQFDIHTGGVDNIFPHHEDEIAQSEGFTGRRFVNYWLHAQHLLADGQKMAKSTGNAYTRADVEARGFDPMALRLLFAMIHYRSRLNFTFSSLRAAEVALRRLRAAALRLVHAAGVHGLPSAQLSRVGASVLSGSQAASRASNGRRILVTMIPPGSVTDLYPDLRALQGPGPAVDGHGVLKGGAARRAAVLEAQGAGAAAAARRGAHGQGEQVIGLI
jgi:cysteinyl-tRNA synthetase